MGMTVDQLRKSLLQYAIEGKLVRQDPNDEPASVLLERVRAEKARLIKEGKVKKDKEESIIFKGADNRYYEKTGCRTLEITSLLPFEIPSSWSWARFSSIANFSIGKTPERKNPDFWNPSDFHWVSISDLKDKGHIAKKNEFISKKAASVCFSTKPIEAGTLLMSFKLTIGKTSILDIPAYFNEAIVAIKPFLVERSHLDFLFTFIGLLAQLA